MSAVSAVMSLGLGEQYSQETLLEINSLGSGRCSQSEKPFGTFFIWEYVLLSDCTETSNDMVSDKCCSAKYSFAVFVLDGSLSRNSKHLNYHLVSYN